MTSKAKIVSSRNPNVSSSSSHSKSRVLGGVSSSRSRIFNSKLSNSSRRVAGLNPAGSNNTAQVYFNGVIATPQSLLLTKPKDPKTSQNDGKDSLFTGNSCLSIDTRSSSQDSSVSMNSELTSSHSFETSSTRGLESNKESSIVLGYGNELEKGMDQEYYYDSQFAKNVPKESKVEEILDPNEPITIRINETPTTFIFHLPSICIAQDSVEHPVVTSRNKQYTQLCSDKNTSDCYRQHHTQTLNYSQKNKEVMAAPPATRDVACVATDWDIYDCEGNDDKKNGLHDHEDNHLDSNKSNSTQKNIKVANTLLAKQVDEIVATSLASPGCLLDVQEELFEPKVVVSTAKEESKKNHSRKYNSSSTMSSATGFSRRSNGMGFSGSISNVNNNYSGSYSSTSDLGSQTTSKEQNTSSTVEKESANNNTNWTNPVNVIDILNQRHSNAILSSSSMITNLQSMERAVQQHVYHHSQLLYRNISQINALEKLDLAQEEDHLTKLWDFRCSYTLGRTVSCMAWNTVNEDLLAVAYGQFDFSGQRDGLVLFWSLKNPDYPERIYKMKYGVTSLDFSHAHPNLLAVGFYNGVIAIYDSRKKEDIPILESSQHAGSHMDAVWQVKWVNKGNTRGETLVSISSDGRITEWSMTKGLSYTDLMLLKRIPRHTLDGADEGIISRQASGHCIDFVPNDSSVYFAGTEDGVIHKCSCSYNEQYLENYFGHTGPVYHIRVSPFWSQLFLSCSSDWTVKLWHQDEQQHLFNFHSVDLTHAVHDVAWSPTHSTVFGSVTADGRIQIWDLDESTLDPVITHYATESSNGFVPQTSILFAKSAPVLVVGGGNGDVGVYRVSMLAKHPKDNTVDEIDQLKKSIYPNRHSGSPE